MTVPLSAPVTGKERISSSVSAAPFIVLGEAPGRFEDLRGKPFIGQAGQLLRSQLKILGIHQHAYFMNTVSCWPKNHKDNHPTADQLHACRGNLRDQLEVADAKFVLAAGGIALQALVPHAKVMKHAMGHLIVIHGKLVFPVYHPSYIIRANDPTLMKKWEENLTTFAWLMATLDDKGEFVPDTCIYCGRVVTGMAPHCYRHITWWKSDQKWERKRRTSGNKDQMKWEFI